SFADPTRLEFAQGISALVGPNGSGKSNIVDSIKWVLGEQSVKKLRAGESTDVIFNGSSTRQQLNSAEVTLTFTNHDRRLTVDADEVHFTRRVYRSGESEYLINGRASRLKDFREILCGTGLGLHAYSIIEQGRVEGLLQSTSQQRRIVLEEAAGTALHRIKMQETERRLERVQQNILRVSDVVNEIENQLRNTKSQAGKAQLFRQYSTRLRELRINVGLVGWYQNLRAASVLNTGLQKKQELSEDLEAEVKQADNELVEQNQQVELHDQEIRRLGKELASLREKIVAEESSRDFQASRIETFRGEIVELGYKLLDLKKRSGGGEDLMRQTDADIAKTTQSLQEVTTSYNDADTILKELTQQCDSLQTQLGETRKTLQLKALEESTRKGEIKGLVSRHKALDKSRTSLLKAIKRLETLALDLAQEHKRRIEDIQQLQNRRTAAEQKRLESENELARLTISRDDTRDELAALRLQQSAITERHSLLAEMIRRNEGHSPGVQEVLTNMSNPQSPFRFAHGLVANLFRVKRPAANLIGFALGKKVEYIIVSPEPELFRHLETHSEKFAGRVGFIWLNAGDETTPWTGSNYENRPGVLGRADQFVETEPLFEPLLRRLLGHTWIVESMNVAKRLYRESDGQTDFLTLKGEHLAPDGTLVVGPPDRYTGLISRQSEYDELSRQLPLMESDIADHAVALELCENRVTAARKQRDDSSRHCRDLDTQFDHLQLDQQTAKSKDTDVQEELADRRNEWTSLQDDIHQVEVDTAQCEQEKTTLHNEQGTLRDELAQGQQSLDALKTRHKEQLEQTNLLRIELEKAKDRLQSLIDRRKQYKDTQDERSQQIGEHYERTLNLTRQRDEAELASLRSESALATFYAKKERIARALAVATRRRQKVVSSRTKIQARLKKTRQEADRLREELHSSQLEIERIELEQQTIMTRMKEDYGIELSENYIITSGFLSARREPADTGSLLDEIIGETQVADTNATANSDAPTETSDESPQAISEDEPTSEDGMTPDSIRQTEEEILEEKIAALDDNKKEIEELKTKLQKLGNVNLEAIETLESLESKYKVLYNQYNDLVASRNSILKIMEMMKNDSQRLFQETFESVKIYFCEIFQQLFGGGHADLVLETPETPLESGIDIIVRPPGKDLKSVMLMSGGEKTLTCIALLLAIFKHRSTPVCILDEVDAALDEGNVGRFVKVVQNLQVDTQFLIITHSRKTMSCGKTMYGVTMQDPGVSTLVGVKFEDVGENGEILARPDKHDNSNQGAA
ncbi:MAG: AAA family ATPase, partial [Thermoguttaceae bacterium]|nr:AAA family ATPase [Thermoguttaceae bacterium]